jgi:starch-binding outer membrane protein, SusD/RagB family
MKYNKKFFLLFLTVVFFSCTKLEEKFNGELEETTSSNISAADLLTNAYNTIAGTYTVGNFWHLQEHTSDELIGPTRGPDWDDNGQWRALHAHTWNADHTLIGGAFSDLLSAQFAASNVLQFNPSAQQAAEARFLRALTIFSVLDGWGQCPYRENLTDYRIDPKTFTAADGIDFIISELNAIINDLPASGPAYVANQNAARVLLMKAYLNKGAFENRAAPTFDQGDMNQVISLADQITGYSLDVNYYDNFAPSNDAVSTENIFTFYSQNGDRGTGTEGTWFQISHYNMDPGGWNGFATLSDFYDKFDASDVRRGQYYAYPQSRPNPGHRVNVGFLAGQQYNLTTDAPLQDRKGNPLIFTPQVSLRETGDNLEVTGIRGEKYAYDYANYNSQNNNDWVVFRYADVLLMKAEAMLRNGDAGGALTIVNQVRTTRGESALGAVTLDDLLDERGKELYWEGWRRQDLIRFGKYLDLWQEKSADDPKNLLFPIPSNQLAVNPNLEQNPGY